MKTTKGFMELTPAECREVYLEVLNNTEAHHRIAKLLADAKEYASAIAHLILATEEHIKSLVLFFDSKGFEVRKVEGMQKLFYMHVPRHNLLKEIFTVWLVMKPFVDKELEKRKKPARTDKIARFLEGSMNVVQLFLSGITGFVNYQWWKDADRLKQKGLYVDYKDGIIVPSQLTESDYQIAAQNAAVIYEDINRLIDFINSLKDAELKSFRKLFEDAQFKNVVSDSIKRKS